MKLATRLLLEESGEAEAGDAVGREHCRHGMGHGHGNGKRRAANWLQVVVHHPADLQRDQASRSAVSDAFTVSVGQNVSL